MKCSNESNSGINAIISGSFRKHLSEIVVLKEKLEKEGINVLSPSGSFSKNPNEEFILLDSDPIDNPELLQSSVFAKMRQSTFIVVANVNGYLGKATILEIGYAIALGLKILTLEPVSDPNLAPYCFELVNYFPEMGVLFDKSPENLKLNIRNQEHAKVATS